MTDQPDPRPEDPQERYIPTPEELEQGVRARRRREADREVEPEARIPLRAKLFRRGKVGRNRKYVEPMPPEARAEKPPTAPPKSLASPAAHVLPVPLPEPGPESEPAADALDETVDVGPTEPEVQKIKSLKFRDHRPKPDAEPATPKSDPSSKEGRFDASASAKGHTMGKLRRVNGRDNLAANCTKCGMHGEIMIETEVGGGPTWEHFGGAAIENRCPVDDR